MRWNCGLSVVGMFIAIIALYAALSESEAVRQQTAAAVWPFRIDHLSERRAEFTIALTNVSRAGTHAFDARHVGRPSGTGIMRLLR